MSASRKRNAGYVTPENTKLDDEDYPGVKENINTNAIYRAWSDKEIVPGVPPSRLSAAPETPGANELIKGFNPDLDENYPGKKAGGKSKRRSKKSKKSRKTRRNKSKR
jgi:hypothetical protein